MRFLFYFGASAHTPCELGFVLQRQQGGVAARCGGVDRKGALGCKAVEVAWTAGFGSSARQPFAAEGLYPDDGADYVAVDVGVADSQAREDIAYGFVDPALDAEGQAVAGSGDLVEHRVEPVGAPAHDMQDRAKHLFGEPLGAVDLEDAGGEKGAVLDPGRQGALV